MDSFEVAYRALVAANERPIVPHFVVLVIPASNRDSTYTVPVAFDANGKPIERN